MSRSKKTIPVSPLSQQVCARLRARAGERNISRAEVSRRVGISQSIGNQIFLGLRSPTLDEMQSMGHVLGLTLTDLIYGPEQK